MLPLFARRSLFNLRLAGLFVLSAAAIEFLFRLLFSVFPNDTAWESAPLYNFEAGLAQAPAKSAGQTRIVIAGSSLATYGYLPQNLTRSGVTALLAAHQGMHGLELASHWRRYAALRPDIVVIPVNMVDLRIERPVLLGLPLEGEQRQDSLLRLCVDLASMYGVRELAGTGMLQEFPQCLSLSQKAEILLGYSNVYRLRTLARPGWSAAWDNRFTRGRSYEHYTGIPVFDEAGRAAVTHRGHVPERFRLRMTPELRRGVDLEILADKALVTVQSKTQAVSFPLSRGWKHVDLGSFEAGSEIEVIFDRGVYFETFADTYAARLAQNTGGRAVQRAPNGFALRERRREDDQYEHMDNDAYRKSFELRNLAFQRPGYAYLEALYNAKKFWKDRRFDPNLPAVQGLALFVQNLRSEGIRVIVVNAPENPLTLSLYENGPYYAGYRDFLRDLGGRDFMDESSSLPAQMFYDFHHLTYGGAERNTDRLLGFLDSGHQP